MSLEQLTQIIELSLSTASSFTRKLFADKTMTAEQVQAYVNEVGNITIATTNREGQPHAAPVIVGCRDGALYFSVSRHSALLRNLHRSSDVAFTVVGNGHTVVGHGVAQFVSAAIDERASAIVPADGRLDRLINEGWDGYIYSLVPSRLFAE